MQRTGAGAAHELHASADGDADRRRPAGLREGHAGEGGGVLGHANGLNIAGRDKRTNEELVTMVLAIIISGGGATPQQDGWHAVGPECCFGALTSGDVELLEYSYPIVIHRYSLMTDSGGVYAAGLRSAKRSWFFAAG